MTVHFYKKGGIFQRSWVLGLPLLLLLLIQCLYFAWDTGQTVDESFFSATGYPAVRYNDYRFLGEHPVLIPQLGALALLILQPHFPIDQPVTLSDPNLIDLTQTGLKFLYQMGNDPQLILFFQRLPVIFLTVILAFILYRWSYKLYGLKGALLSLTLFVFSPNVIAHGSLFTTDMGVTTFIFLTIYRIKKLSESFTTRNAFWLGVFCGLTILAKMSGLVVLPMVLFFVCLMVLFTERRDMALRHIDAYEPWPTILAFVLFLFALSYKLTIIALAPICLSVIAVSMYRLKVSKNLPWMQWFFLLLGIGWMVCFAIVVRLNDFSPSFKVAAGTSALFLLFFNLLAFFKRGQPQYMAALKMFSFIGCVAALVIMIDYTDYFNTLFRGKPFAHYLRTFKISYSHMTSLHGHCVEGSFITCDWKYFLAVMMAKTPVVTLLLAFWGAISIFSSKLSKFDKYLLFLPPLTFLLVASLVSRVYIGLRHVLPVYPFLFLMAGASASITDKISQKSLRVLAYGILWSAVIFSVSRNLSFAPHYLSYFSEWVGGVEEGALYTVDSNISWGQDNRRLAEMVRKLEIPSIKMAVSTVNAAELEYYNVLWDPMAEEDFVHPSQGYYALDIHAYVNLKAKPESWFYGREPNWRVGKTIYIFHVPSGIQS